MLLPAGTTIYLTKRPPFELLLEPGANLYNDTLYVAYDVKDGTQIIIPKGTPVKGDWITEYLLSGLPVAQLQLRSIFLYGNSNNVRAISPVSLYDTTSLYNKAEVENSKNFKRTKTYRSTANLIRRFVDVKCKSKVLMDRNPNDAYVRINTKEIPVTLLQDF